MNANAVKMLRNSYEALLFVHEAVRMDTAEDTDLHRRAVEQFRLALRIFDALCPLPDITTPPEERQ